MKFLGVPVTEKVIRDMLVFVGSNVAMWYAIKYILDNMHPDSKKRKEAKKVSKTKLKALGLSEKTHPDLANLNEHEESISTELILPHDIKETFDSIGGLDGIISSLQESVIAPLCFPEVFESSGALLGAPKGVLLYGPPGTGKTMLAKALAKESGATFINMHVSTMTNKWFGESNKLVAALFSLARKLQPTIIFIDEIDSFMRERNTGDHEVTAMMKAEFMTLWDGLTSGSDRIMVLGATNRPNDIDAAILRRMPKRYAVLLPDAPQRKRILEIMLRGTNLEPGFDLDQIVRKTEGHSGSELKEICRNAAMVPIREILRSPEGRKLVLRSQREPGPNGEPPVSGRPTTAELEALAKIAKPRAVRTSDFFQNDAATSLDGNMVVDKGRRTARPAAAARPPQAPLD